VEALEALRCEQALLGDRIDDYRKRLATSFNWRCEMLRRLPEGAGGSGFEVTLLKNSRRSGPGGVSFRKFYGRFRAMDPETAAVCLVRWAWPHGRWAEAYYCALQTRRRRDRQGVRFSALHMGDLASIAARGAGQACAYNLRQLLRSTVSRQRAARRRLRFTMPATKPPCRQSDSGMRNPNGVRLMGPSCKLFPGLASMVMDQQM